MCGSWLNVCLFTSVHRISLQKSYGLFKCSYANLFFLREKERERERRAFLLLLNKSSLLSIFLLTCLLPPDIAWSDLGVNLLRHPEKIGSCHKSFLLEIIFCSVEWWILNLRSVASIKAIKMLQHPYCPNYLNSWFISAEIINKINY